MLEGKVFVRKLAAIDGLSTRTVVVRKVTALTHKLGDDAVETRSGKTESFFARAKRTKILCRLGDDIGAELHQDAADRLAADFHVLR